MSEPSEKQPRPRPKQRRRWLQISLRTLLGVTTLVAVGATSLRWYIELFQRQESAMAAIEKAGGRYETAAAGPKWLRRVFGEESLQNITLVNVADCDDPAAYLDYVARLPALETLVVGGPTFTDAHLGRLYGLTTLHGLVLDSTDVSDEALAAFREALPEAEVYRSQRRAIAALRKAGCEVPGSKISDPRLHRLTGV